MIHWPLLTGMLCLLLLPTSLTSAEDPSNEPGLIQRLENQAKQVGKSVEQSLKKTAKDVEEKRIPEKMEKKAKEIVDDVVQGFEKTGKNLEKKLGK